ncbi:MAG: SIS domain-containing protein [Candidatus Desulfaltia sp.]|nr:SIS domain-containing protein [Candidatus Desulfaltia sp.]
MLLTPWKQEIDKLCGILHKLSFTGYDGVEYSVDEGFQLWQELTIDVREKKRSIYLIGNGASASMASHFAADLAKNAHLHTEVFTDLSFITAISNDLGYEWVFSEPLQRRAKKGDMLVAISSSGNSKNILCATEVALKIGLKVITLSAMSPQNPLRTSGSLNIYIPAQTYGYAETCHAAILHHWMDMVELNSERITRCLSEQSGDPVPSGRRG